MICGTASKSFAKRRRLPQTIRISPLVWMNAVCLDAPLVAVSWVWLFARSFDVPVATSGLTALFLTAWLIYLADRLGDTVLIDRRRVTSFRQRVCLEHRRAWLIVTAAVAVADLAVVGAQFRSGFVMSGAAVGAMVLAYLLVNQFRPAIWRVVPLKEVAVGALFAAGTMVPIAAHLPSTAIRSWCLFAALCTLNCISIAAWERWLDTAQERVSIATALPRVGGLVLPALLLLASVSFALGLLHVAGRSIYICVSISAALLAFTHASRRRIQPDVRTALADLELLTPAVLLAID